jgi:predicted dinucleotide-binding enzyme
LGHGTTIENLYYGFRGFLFLVKLGPKKGKKMKKIELKKSMIFKIAVFIVSCGFILESFAIRSYASDIDLSNLKRPAAIKAGTGVGLKEKLDGGYSEKDVDLIASEFELSEIEKSYFKNLFLKFIALQKLAESVSDKPKDELLIDQDFIPSAMMSPEGRANLLDAVEYSDIANDPENAKSASRVTLILNPLNGGIGKGVGRETYLDLLWPRLKDSLLKKNDFEGEKSLGGKPTDLFFELDVRGKKELISIAEAKLLRSIEEAKAKKYSSIVLEELISQETLNSVNELFDTIYFWDRIDNTIALDKKRTYRQFFEEFSKTEKVRISLADPVTEHTFPLIDKEKGEFRPRFEKNGKGRTKVHNAPGGHGLSGFWSIMRVFDDKFTPSQDKTKPTISVMYNEDGMNSFPNEIIVGWMARNKVPIVMITTTKTGIDMKGGQIGIQTLPSGKNKKAILELKQAEKNKQKKLFEAMGLTEGTKGAQYFNTNMAMLNYTILKPFLRELADYLGKERLEEIISPDLIQEDSKDKKSHSLGGAMGSVLLNLTSFVETTEDKRIIEIARKHGLVNKEKRISILRIINADEENRTKFFTPVKTAFDFWLQYYSDFYKVDTANWQLIQLGKHLPAVDLKDDWYKEVTNVMDAFKGVKVAELKELNIQGVVKMQNAVLEDKVNINIALNHPIIVDLNSRAIKSKVRQKGNWKLDDNDLKIKINVPETLAVRDFNAKVDLESNIKIAIVGGAKPGSMGNSIGLRAKKGGARITYGSRTADPEKGILTNEDAVKDADIVLLALPWKREFEERVEVEEEGVRRVVKVKKKEYPLRDNAKKLVPLMKDGAAIANIATVFENIEGKLTYLPEIEGVRYDSVAEMLKGIVTEVAPGKKIKIVNSGLQIVPEEHMGDPFLDLTMEIVVCGDDSEACSLVSEHLVEKISQVKSKIISGEGELKKSRDSERATPRIIASQKELILPGSMPTSELLELINKNPDVTTEELVNINRKQALDNNLLNKYRDAKAFSRDIYDVSSLKRSEGYRENVAGNLKRYSEILPQSEEAKIAVIKNALSRYKINLAEAKILRSLPGNFGMFTSTLKNVKFENGALVIKADVFLQNAGLIAVLREIKSVLGDLSIVVWTTQKDQIRALGIMGVGEIAEIQFKGINEVLAELSNKGITEEHIKVINSESQFVLSEILKDRKDIRAFLLSKPKVKENSINVASFFIAKAVVDIVKDQRLNEVVNGLAEANGISKDALDRLEAITSQIVEMPLAKVDKKVARFQQSFEQTVTDI